MTMGSLPHFYCGYERLVLYLSNPTKGLTMDDTLGSNPNVEAKLRPSNAITHGGQFALRLCMLIAWLAKLTFSHTCYFVDKSPATGSPSMY